MNGWYLVPIGTSAMQLPYLRLGTLPKQIAKRFVKARGLGNLILRESREWYMGGSKKREGNWGNYIFILMFSKEKMATEVLEVDEIDQGVV